MDIHTDAGITAAIDPNGSGWHLDELFEALGLDEGDYEEGCKPPWTALLDVVRKHAARLRRLPQGGEVAILTEGMVIMLVDDEPMSVDIRGGQVTRATPRSANSHDGLSRGRLL